MKKLGILACAALASLCTANLSAAVESDIVGYTTISLEAGKWYQIGTPFANLDPSVAEVSINNIFTGFGEGDVIMVYDNVGNKGYRQAFWRAAANANAGGWCTTDGGPLIASALKVKAGDAVFINKKNGNLDLTFSGRVVYQEVPFGHKEGNAWAMVTPVWPMDITLDKLDFTELGEGDAVMIYSPEKGYSQGFWRPAANANAGGWCTTDGGPMIPFKPTIKAGYALFIKKSTPKVGTILVK